MITEKFLTSNARLSVGRISMQSVILLKTLQKKNATLQLARHKIYALGSIKSHSCLVNNKDAICKIKNRLTLAKLMSFITGKDKKSQSNKETNDIKELLSIGFDAVQKLTKTNKPKKVTKK